MADSAYEILTESNQQELAKQVLLDLETRLFLADAQVAVNVGNPYVSEEEQEKATAQLPKCVEALKRAREKYQPLLDKPEESKEESSA